MEADSQVDRFFGVSLAVLGELPMQRDPTAHTGERAGERNQEVVAAEFDFVSAEGLTFAAHDFVVRLYDLQGRAISKAFSHRGVARHVTEHQRDLTFGVDCTAQVRSGGVY